MKRYAAQAEMGIRDMDDAGASHAKGVSAQMNLLPYYIGRWQ